LFFSILYPTKEKANASYLNQADCFKDLNLGQLFDYIFKSKIIFNLEPIFYYPPNDKETILYRQGVLRELQDPAKFMFAAGFSQNVFQQGQMLNMAHDSFESVEKWRNNYMARGQLLDAAEHYIAAIDMFAEQLKTVTFTSEGLKGLTAYITHYRESAEFTELRAHAKRIRDKLSEVHYTMYIDIVDAKIRVRKFADEVDFTNSIENLFDKFRQGESGERYFPKIKEEPTNPRIEAQVLEMLASIYKDAFNELNTFADKYYNFIDKTIVDFSREIQFYLGWIELVQPLIAAGLPFCFPLVAEGQEKIYVDGGFDIALAYRRHGEGIITNDWHLDYPERVIVLTGPNQGGKTTFTRSFGQAHYLAALGLSVPGRSASLFLFDRILTHFGREEDISAESGVLQSDLRRLKELLALTTDRSIMLINEIFSSTTLSDALVLGKHMMEDVVKMGGPAIIVTFLDELANPTPEKVSMMSYVDPEAPETRSFKIVRRPADGLAYAIYIAGRHGLTYDQLKERYSHVNAD